jgi:hypothetical protein
MPLVVDTFKTGSIDTNQLITNIVMKEVDNTDSYPNSIVLSSFNKTGKIVTPSNNLNIYTIKSKMEMLEVEDFYFVFLGTLFSDSQIKISNLKGSFNNIPDFIADLSMPYSFRALVEDAESPGDVYTISFAGVDIIQVNTNEYLLGAQFFTQSTGENFLAYVDLDIELTSESEISYSNLPL